MRAITVYRPNKAKKVKSLFLIALLLAAAFLAGAIAEKTAHFLQDVTAAAPVALDRMKSFLRERFIFKINTAAEQLKWAAVIIITIANETGSHVIRGP
ncbi:hypothetical protein [Pelotomaculum propionicicum]|uniref:Uncharacterized protein n=1 Tax=Pelotomaculum propionicicum TaxID=258475 RepID=A0A4Y7RXI9_9FIRM|nr:hypothetical protein [Pelotomaculum propionicicum]NLI14295.1 hypothetical protein [Peptococcaceae bacterium]TEB13718.1 hypothetical protein Pmgp_00121 [Pelotomaculum propionicicum]